MSPGGPRLRIDRGTGDGGLRIVVDGEHFVLGDDLSDRFGFDEARLDERILRILVTLALRRRSGGPGWMTAEELGLLALAGASGSATAKRLEVSLRATCRGGTRLIEFPAPAPGQGGRGGRSRGPYRLGVAPEALELDDEACWQFLAGQPLPREHADHRDLAGLLDAARTEMHAGRFLRARARASRALEAIFAGTADGPPPASPRDRCFSLGQTFALLANIDLHLGSTGAGILAARRAHAYFERVKHPEGEAQALDIEAHLRGQLDDPTELRRSFVAARNALARLDDARRTLRKGVQRAVYVGTLGQRQSRLGDTRQAAKRLQSAYRLCQDATSPSWMGVWAMRLGQNALVAGELAAAEKFIASAHDVGAALTPSGQAALTRATAELHLAAGRWGEAERWIARARAIGEDLAMGYQIRLATRLLEQLEHHK